MFIQLMGDMILESGDYYNEYIKSLVGAAFPAFGVFYHRSWSAPTTPLSCHSFRESRNPATHSKLYERERVGGIV